MENNSNSLDAVLNSIGATAELCGVAYASFIAQGFTELQAFELVKTILASMFTPNKS